MSKGQRGKLSYHRCGLSCKAEWSAEALRGYRGETSDRERHQGGSKAARNSVVMNTACRRDTAVWSLHTHSHPHCRPSRCSVDQKFPTSKYPEVAAPPLTR